MWHWRYALVMLDFRYALRKLRSSPGFASLSIFTLAVGVGVNTALFSIVDTLLLRDLPFKDASRLVYVTEFWPHEPIVPGPPSPDFENWRRHSQLIDGIAAYGGGADALTLTGAGDPMRIDATMVTAKLLDLIGARLEWGRNFTEREDSAGGAPAVILGARLWRERFGSSRKVVGRTIDLGGIARTVVGVLRDDFVFPDNHFSPDLLVPMILPADPNWHDDTNFRLLRVLAHLKAGVSEGALRAEFSALVAATKSQEPPQMVTMRRDMEIRVIPLRAWLSGDVRRLVLVLQAAVLMVLLIGCANVANLQIARSISRRKEMALRLALGASRGRLIRQLLTEGLLYAAIGAIAGLAASYLATGWLRSFLPANLHLADRIHIDAVVLMFTLAIAILAGLLTGLAPVISIWRSELIEAIKTGSGRATQGLSHHRLRGALVVGEVAIAIVLLAAAGVLIHNFLHAADLDPGFQPAGVVSMRIAKPYKDPSAAHEYRNFFTQVLEGARAIPGVETAALSTGIPPAGTLGYGGIGFEGKPAPPGGRPSLPVNIITPDYFGTLGIPILRGRAFTAADREHSPPVAMVNQAFAEEFFPGEDALGKRIEVASRDGSWSEIVGIAGNVREQGRRPFDSMVVYVPFGQFDEFEMILSFKSSMPRAASATIKAAMKAVHSADPNQAVYDVATMRERLSESISVARANMLLMGIFAGLAFLLAAIGILGVLADFVSRRSHEIGVRMALGARPRDVVAIVVREGMLLTAVGIGVGLSGSFAIVRVLRTLVSGVAVNDPATFAIVSLVFLLIAAGACYLPARRASRVDPATVLRDE